MAIDFPNSPSVNQIYTVGSRSWIWDGTTWNIYSNTPTRYIQDAAPSSPQSGDQWFESDTGRLFVYYDSYWVEIGNATDIAGALQPGQVTALSAVTSLTTDDVFPVIDNPSSATAANKITYGNLVTAMDASLAPGLVLVKTQSIGTSVNTQNITSCFSSTYDNYYIDVSGITSSANSSMSFSLLSGTTVNSSNWAGNTYYVVTAATGALTNFNFTSSATAECGSLHTASTNYFSFWLYGPYLSTYTRINFTSMDNNYLRIGSALHKASTSYDGLKLDFGVNTMTGGIIRVYGYRNS